jgi:hypothetical protein
MNPTPIMRSQLTHSFFILVLDVACDSDRSCAYIDDDYDDEYYCNILICEAAAPAAPMSKWVSIRRRHGSSYSSSSRMSMATSSSSSRSSIPHSSAPRRQRRRPCSEQLLNNPQNSQKIKNPSSHNNNFNFNFNNNFNNNKNSFNTVKTLPTSSTKKGNSHINLTLHNNISSTNHQTGLESGRHFWGFC